MASAWRSYLKRSIEHLRDRSADVLRAQPTPIHGTVLPLVTLKSSEDLRQFIKGCDADLGGKSIANLDLGPEGKGRFWGSLSNELHTGRRKEGVIERGGYAGFRTKQRTTVFGTRFWNTELHDFLRLRVKSSGDGMKYFVNIQTDGPGRSGNVILLPGTLSSHTHPPLPPFPTVRSDLFQHRLWLPSPTSPEAPHEWCDVLIPLEDFALTNSGDMSELQIEMYRAKVRTVGISVLGPKQGRYELGIESIDAVSLDKAQVDSARKEPSSASLEKM
ncbi:BQ5605_C013g07377 [Microbotryum silenes-dioicae]|uniref:BQ5605_C013g07377 protein n=1 Tax=Microbotryum silenes-dioicae TaxID=796604 RepID=A0A2X0NUK8_9BASI|nr:BQ5605_C013g07377 [Microbotryum silenes-dioicae]